MSFNELAWILIFALGLIALQAWSLGKSKTEDLAARTGTVTSLEKTLRQKEDDIQKLRNQVTALGAENSTLGNGLAQAEIDKASRAELERMIRDQLAQIERQKAAILELEKSLADWRSRFAQLEQKYSDLEQKHKALEAEVSDLKAKAKADAARIEELEKQLKDRDAAPKAEGLPKQLLGFSGRMERVVLLIDRSSSMESRWTATLELVDTWIQYLPISECALVVFDSDLKRIPANGKMLSVKGVQGVANRKALFAEVPKHTSGATGTYAALETAYRYAGVDTLILFTDGAPSQQEGFTNSGLETSSRNEQLMRNIEGLVRQHPGIVVNCVGVGDYYKDRRLTEFLVKVAQITGGGFIGK